MSENPEYPEYFKNFSKYTKQRLEISNLFYGSKSPEYFNLPQKLTYLFYDNSSVTSEIEFIDKDNIYFIINIQRICEFDSPYYDDRFLVMPKGEYKLRFEVKKMQGQYKIIGLSYKGLHKIERLGSVINYNNAWEASHGRKQIDKSKLSKIQEICGVHFDLDYCNNFTECMDVMNKHHKAAFEGL